MGLTEAGVETVPYGRPGDRRQDPFIFTVYSLIWNGVPIHLDGSSHIAIRLA